MLLLLTAIAFSWLMTGHQRDNAGDIELGGNSWLPAAPAEGKQLRALTLNCWGLWVVAKQRQQRIRCCSQWRIHASRLRMCWVMRQRGSSLEDTCIKAAQVLMHESGNSDGTCSSKRQLCLASRSCRAIAKYLERTNAEVVVLQEVFLRADADTLISGGARGGLPYSQRFRGGILGGELVTLSRHPIIAVRFGGTGCQRSLTCCNDGCRRCCAAVAQVHFEQFRASGNPVAILQGDYFAGKGIGHTRIATPHGTVVSDA